MKTIQDAKDLLQELYPGAFVDLQPVDTTYKRTVPSAPYVFLDEGYLKMVAPITGEVLMANISLDLCSAADGPLVSRSEDHVVLGRRTLFHDPKTQTSAERILELRNEIIRLRNRNLWQRIWNL